MAGQAESAVSFFLIRLSDAIAMGTKRVGVLVKLGGKQRAVSVGRR